MKNLLFISGILILLFKTGNVLSDNILFTVNNVEINKEIYKNKENLVNQAFQKAYKKLIKRLLLKDDFDKVSNINLNQVKKLISYYQIINSDKDVTNNSVKFNVFFEKERMHNFFYNRNILYSDIINTEIILFPLLKVNDELFIYSQNYFYEKWNENIETDLIQYSLPVESIESIQKIKSNKDNFFELDVSNFFIEYENKNLVFIIIEIENKYSKIFLNTKISGKIINKTFKVDYTEKNRDQFYNKIILQTKETIRDLIKSQNLIDVKTPSFLNVKIQLDNKSNLVEFKNRIKKINLINNFFVEQLNKDYVLIKIKYLGKIDKIINKLKDQNIDLKIIEGQWLINII
ncbi:hypothetical protein OAS21_00885 [Pelagibacteraceae bacterium]|jgi:hypothetical protein|nr:hypothetical protein [Pelagibacteraceae bacterium]